MEHSSIYLAIVVATVCVILVRRKPNEVSTVRPFIVGFGTLAVMWAAIGLVRLIL